MIDDRRQLERLWVVSVLVVSATLAVGSALFPRRVFDGFLWKYFWGPVEADGRNLACVARLDGETYVPETCVNAAGYVAEPGYTLVSTVSYGLILIWMLVGVYFLVDRLDIATERSFVYPLVPFIFFGGTLRTIEDASIELMVETGTPAIPFPYSAAIISPFIYFVVFAVTVLAIVLSVWAANRNYIDRYEYGLAAVGSLLLAVAVGYLGYLAVGTEVLTFNASVPFITLVGATVITALVWWATEQYVPSVNDGTRLVGALVIWGHAVDGVANVLSLDWANELGLPQYAPKHVVNAAVRDITGAVQPAWLSEAIGITWPFLPLKVLAATAIVWLFNDELYEESPRYTIVLLVTVLAIGLGPGTRDFLRATLGI